MELEVLHELSSQHSEAALLQGRLDLFLRLGYQRQLPYFSHSMKMKADPCPYLKKLLKFPIFLVFCHIVDQKH